MNNDLVIPNIVMKWVGNNATISCSSANEVQWSFNGGFLPHNSGVVYNDKISLNFISLKNLEKNNSGIYTCITTDNGEFSVYETFLTVTSKLKNYCEACQQRSS